MNVRRMVLVATVAASLIFNQPSHQHTFENNFKNKMPMVQEKNGEKQQTQTGSKKIFTGQIKKQIKGNRHLNFLIEITNDRLAYGVLTTINGKEEYIPIADRKIKGEVIAAAVCDKGIVMIINNGNESAVLFDKLDGGTLNAQRSLIKYKNATITLKENGKKLVFEADGISENNKDKNKDKEYTMEITIRDNWMFMYSPEKTQE